MLGETFKDISQDSVHQRLLVELLKGFVPGQSSTAFRGEEHHGFLSGERFQQRSAESNTTTTKVHCQVGVLLRFVEQSIMISVPGQISTARGGADFRGEVFTALSQDRVQQHFVEQTLVSVLKASFSSFVECAFAKVLKALSFATRRTRRTMRRTKTWTRWVGHSHVFPLGSSPRGCAGGTLPGTAGRCGCMFAHWASELHPHKRGSHDSLGSSLSLLGDYSATFVLAVSCAMSWCFLVRQQIQFIRQFGGLGAFTHFYIFADPCF